MAKSKALIAAETQIALLRRHGDEAEALHQAAAARVAALEARLAVATEVYRNQRAQIADLQSQLAARGAAKVIPQERVTEFAKRDGSRWIKTQCGSTARYMRIDEVAVM